jgi:DNA-binding NarL/FixJ family response regulator
MVRGRLPVAGMRERLGIGDPSSMDLTCLIVDDNLPFLESASELLGREGLEVVGVASSSTEAIRLASELRPDVTLVDIDLGEEDGFELARRLSLASGAATRVILVSTHSEQDLGELIAASPALGFIQKTRLSASTIRATLERAA